MATLDDLAAVNAADPQQMGTRIAELPTQMQTAWAFGQNASLPATLKGATSILALGMGGSAVGADIVRGILQPQLTVPFSVWRDYGLPGFVGPSTLVLVLSHSGGTEETLSAFEAALARGAKVIAITTGGRLAEIAQQRGVPLVTYSYDSQPRAALGYLFTLPFSILCKLGYVPDQGADVAATVQLMTALRDQYAPAQPTNTNQAKQLAQSLYGRMVVAYGGGPFAVVSQRWKNQFNENAKTWGLFEALPELNHNAVVGFEHPPAIRQLLHVLFLTAPSALERIRQREEITKQLLDRVGISHDTIEGSGSTVLQQVMSAIYLGDYASYYLALLNQVDPTPVDAISMLKEALSRSPGSLGV